MHVHKATTATVKLAVVQQCHDLLSGGYWGVFKFLQQLYGCVPVGWCAASHFQYHVGMANDQPCFQQCHELVVTLFEMSYPNRSIDQHVHG